MMTSALIQCDGADVPSEFGSVSWNKCEAISHRGGSPNLSLRLQNLSHALISTIDSFAADLIRISAYVYAADQSVRRGGPTDIYVKHWKRHFGMVVPVSDPDFWNEANVRRQLEETLSFLSEDQWQFAFTQAEPDIQQLALDPSGAAELLGSPDSVVLFSGGADSLCAIIEAVTENGLHPVLVSHRTAPPIVTRQKRLAEELRMRLGNWEFPQIGVWINRPGKDAADTNQRTRSFLFASLGAAIASTLNLEQVLLADNGVISLNLPINAGIVGAHASRTTHPKFLRLLNDFLKLLPLSDVTVTNPLWSRTRAETLTILKDNGAPDLLQETNSCSHARGGPLATPHCGVCLQCVDRRFASEAAGLQEHDLPERYGCDIFTDELSEGRDRTVAESYIRFALDIRRKTDDDLFSAFPQLYDCIDGHGDQVYRKAEKLVKLLERHADQTLKVMSGQLREHIGDLMDGSLPGTCLVRLVASGRHHEDPRLPVIQSLTDALRRGLPPIFQDRQPCNERDVQNAVEGIVRSSEGNLHREVPVLPFAGISTKPDFARLPEEGKGWLFIEMKYPSKREYRNRIITEITSRQFVYTRQGAFVLFVVYDPGRHIVNDNEFTDICSDTDGVWIEVVR